MDLSHLGSMIRFHRKRGKLSQQELARLAGIGKTVVFDVEKGKESIRLDSLMKILHVLNIKINFLSPLMSRFKEEIHEES